MHDTALGHLAGAIGHPVWMLLSFLVDWRWMYKRSDTPWYPTMRLFRQNQLDVWDDVFDQVVNEIRFITDSRQKLPTPG